MVPVWGDVAEARRCHRRYRSVSEYPHAVGERLVNKIPVIVLGPARNWSDEKCQACPGRSGTAVSSGKARVWNAPSRAFGPLTSRQTSGRRLGPKLPGHHTWTDETHAGISSSKGSTCVPESVIPPEIDGGKRVGLVDRLEGLFGEKCIVPVARLDKLGGDRCLLYTSPSPRD